MIPKIYYFALDVASQRSLSQLLGGYRRTGKLDLKTSSFLKKKCFFSLKQSFLRYTEFKIPVLLAIPVYLIARMSSGHLILNYKLCQYLKLGNDSVERVLVIQVL